MLEKAEGKTKILGLNTTTPYSIWYTAHLCFDAYIANVALCIVILLLIYTFAPRNDDRSQIV